VSHSKTGLLITPSDPDPTLTLTLTRVLNCRIAGSSSSSGSVKGYARLSDHTLGITAIAVGLGSFPNVRLLTASKDNTAKVKTAQDKIGSPTQPT